AGVQAARRRDPVPAFAHYHDEVEPRLRGEPEPPEPEPELTLAELVDVYLDRHAQIRSAGTIRTLRERLARPLTIYGAVTLAELEGMAGDLADFRGTLRSGRPTTSCARSGRCSPPGSVTATCERTRRLTRARTRSRRRGRSASA